MNKKDFILRTKIIKESFKDERPIKCPTPCEIKKLDDNVHPGGDIFTTEDGDFIDFEFQLNDFDEEELAKYVGFAESLYEKHHKHVAIYLLCHHDIEVSVKEIEITSEAEFTIKLACSKFDPCHIILETVKDKLKNNIPLESDDIDVVRILPVMCKKNERNYFRLETLKILNQIQ
ncbi:MULTISPECIES: hypothetical protein [unclassified Methanobrevibacter]|uniref:hypothetical protein n=1 Tax=unclassified Methanobrevibacter TaxID=2638681 RepID=UPI0027337782|nr:MULTISPECIES: hypothetical protein [unclassified Methanobrevibacter]